jgi:Rieske 2Fe-2S family protein
MLNKPVRTLPSSCYFDAEVYAREITHIFLADWICIGHESDWESAGSFRRLNVADRQIIIVRQHDSSLLGFYNTCRHRGSALCETESGRFPAGRIICPYHAWVYDLNGSLLKASRLPDGFELENESLSLYPVTVESWNGFVFVNLADHPLRSLPESLGEEAGMLDNWRMESLAVAHRETHRVACNWKVFWENYLECLHCPGVHPDLCRLVPVYGRGVVSRSDLPVDDPLRDAPRLRVGAMTWTANGQPLLPPFPGLTDEERDAGMTFFTSLPSVFIVGHIDYVRSVRVSPVAPEATDIAIDWLVEPGALASGELDIDALTVFGRQVVLEDARVCELNQRGLRNPAHEHGILMAQEYDIAWFHEWLHSRLK